MEIANLFLWKCHNFEGPTFHSCGETSSEVFLRTVHTLGKTTKLLGALIALIAITLGSSQAAIVISLDQVGLDVVATFSGTMGIDSTTTNEAGGNYSIYSEYFFAFSGQTGNTTGLLGSKAPLDFFLPTSPTFDPTNNFGYSWTGNLYGPANFTATTAVSGSLRFANQTLAGMGALFSSDLVVLRTSGGEALVTYSANAVPEPSTAALLGLGVIGGAIALRRKLLLAKN